MREKLLEIQEKYPDTKECPKSLWLAFYCIHGDLKGNCESYTDFKNWLMRDEVLTPAQLLIELKRDDNTVSTKKYIDELKDKYVKEKEYKEQWWQK